MSGDDVGQIFESHLRLIESTAARVADPDDVADVVQQVGLRMCLHLRGGFHPSQISVWIYRTTIREASKWRRGEGRHEGRRVAAHAVRPSDPEVARSPADQFEDQDALERLAATIGRLRAPHLGVVRDIVATGGVSYTAMQRHRARRQLRDLLQ